RSVVFRRIGSGVDWDGSRFRQLNTAVLIPFGAVLLVDRLKAMEVAADDKGKTLEANLVKLLAGRGDVVIGAETSGFALLNDPQFKDKIEMLPTPFSEEPYYLGLSKQYHGANAELAERLWNAIGRIRKSPAYLREYEKAVRLAAKEMKE
ncbi:MAG: hypothetical protein V4582_12465, partial [Pseudomonadota bacterium]